MTTMASNGACARSVPPLIEREHGHIADILLDYLLRHDRPVLVIDRPREIERFSLRFSL